MGRGGKPETLELAGKFILDVRRVDDLSNSSE
jgi:hypothetical protein